MPTPISGSAYSSVSLSSSSTINALVGGDKWGSSGAGTAASISYSFPVSGSLWSTSSVNGYGSFSGSGEPWSTSYRVLNSVQQTAFRSAIQAWANVANIQITEVSETSTQVGDIRIAFSALDPGYSAWAYYPYSGPKAGDIWLNTAASTNNVPTVGSFGYSTLVHELGHALGLKHPFSAENSNTAVLPTAEDNQRYSVMSYTSAPNSGTEASTPMLYDVQAIQYIYGANTSYNTGNDTYSFSTSTEVMQTIWDAGGTDTIDASNQTLNVTIDLRAGTFSSIGPGIGGAAAVDNIAIAYNVLIENAIGGSGHDAIHGNSSANTLIGGGGDDTIYTEGGDDTVIGGSGGDTVHMGASGGVLTLTEVEAVVGGAGYDHLNFTSQGTTTVLSGVEVALGGVNTDVITLSGAGSTLIGVRLETLIGSSGTDQFVMGHLGSTTVLSGVEVALGGVNTDVITLFGAGSTLIGVRLETLIGSSGTDQFVMGHLGSTTVLSGMEVALGGVNTDVITLSDPGSTLIGVRLETLIGSSGTDQFVMGHLGSTTVLSGMEVALGGVNTDVITLSDPGSTLIGVRLETLIGSSGTDQFVMGHLGSTTVLSGMEVALGGVNTDVITLSDPGSTLIGVRLETLIGSAGIDRFLMGHLGSTTVLSGIEEVFGGLNTDVIALGTAAPGLRIQGIETLSGSVGNDGVTVADGGGLTFVGGLGADSLILTAAAAVDVVGFTDVGDGGAAGAGGGFDTVSGFQADLDRVSIGGALRSLMDGNGDGVLATAVRDTNAAMAGRDELVVLSRTLTSLADNDLAAVRAGLGTVGGGVAASFLVMGTDGNATGLYAVSENGDGTVAASEIRLLCRFDSSLLTGSNVQLA